MGIFGLSNKAISFLGGVAEGVEEVIDKDEDYVNDLAKETSSLIVKDRLDSKERRRQRVGEYSKELSQLVAIGYGKQEAAGIVNQGLTNDFIKLAKTTPKDKLNTLYKVTSKYQGETPLSISDLAEAIAGKYEQPTIDLSGIPKRKTFLSAIGLEADPTEKIRQRVESLTPTEAGDKTVDFDTLSAALSGKATPIAQEKLRTTSGEISFTYASNEFTNALNMVYGGKSFYDATGRQRFALDKNEDAQRAMLESSKYLKEFTERVNAGEDRQNVYYDILNRILGMKITKKSDTDDKQNIKDKDVVPKKDGDDNKKPEIIKKPFNEEKVTEIVKGYMTKENKDKYKSLPTAKERADFRKRFIRQLVEQGGMSREAAEKTVKLTFPDI
jgi:hypothetical protein